MAILNYLLRNGYVSFEQKEKVQSLAERWDVSTNRVLQTLQLVKPEIIRAAHQVELNIKSCVWEELEWDTAAEEKFGWQHFCKHLALPLRRKQTPIIASVDPLDLPTDLRNYYVYRELLLESDWVNAVSRFQGSRFLDQAVNGLLRSHPEASAKQTFTRPQIFFGWLLLTMFAASLAWFPVATVTAINCLLNLFYFVCIGFKTLLVFVGSSRNTARKVSEEEIYDIPESQLPIYTILVPVYKEPKVIVHLVDQLQALNYPLAKLDVKVLLEADDQATIDAFQAAHPPPNFQAIVIPAAQPKTKPKACNYGLQLARGEYLTIYDAEDLPELDQLRKVVAAFKRLPSRSICIQAALNYFNWPENFLTRMFTLEYSSWFDYNLPGMEALKVPIPLGGTSNHFKTDKLIQLGAWDPFNVTEDADLGVRATVVGYTVATIDSTTFEEANRAYGNWIRQRSRWIKGYMQTFLVNMRRPFHLLRTIGLRGFIGFSLFIGGTPFIFLVNPILWAIFFIWIVTHSEFFDLFFPSWLLLLSFFNLFLGNFLAVYVSILSVFKRRNYPLAPFGLLNPLYWFLHAFASYKALWQLIVKPFYWEKTEHGLSTMMPGSAAKVAKAA
jgi:cellulose synthase/poly-beta-1,6-N-acetylglucosamine synthase-like glycosyltransferase